ncbi:MAG: DUF503 domain-containing protein [bacterium]
MPVGVMRIDLHLPGVNSLKGKRRIVQRLKAMIRNRYNLSVVEMDHQDLHRRAVIGVAGISASREILEEEMRGVLQLIDRQKDCETMDRTIEYVE